MSIIELDDVFRPHDLSSLIHDQEIALQRLEGQLQEVEEAIQNLEVDRLFLVEGAIARGIDPSAFMDWIDRGAKRYF